MTFVLCGALHLSSHIHTLFSTSLMRSDSQAHSGATGRHPWLSIARMPSCQRCLSRSALLRSQLTGDISANTGRIVAGVDANDSSSPRTTDNPVGCIDGAVAGAPCQMAHRRYHYTASMLLPAAMRSMQHSVPQMAQLHRRRNRVPKPTKTQSWQPSSGGHTAHLSCRRHGSSRPHRSRTLRPH